MLNEGQIFWNNMERIKDSLLLNDQEFASSLGLSTVDYSKFKNTSKLLPLNCVFEFAEKMNFHFADLMEKDFQLQSIKNLNSGSDRIPDRYNCATYSEIQPIRNIISYLEIVRGLRAKTNLIRKFQLTENFFNNENQKTNIFLISDIVKYLSQTYRFSDAEFLAMGQRTPFVVKGNFLESKLSNQKTVEEVVSAFFEECTHLFDKNYHYKISSMRNGQAIIEAAPIKHVLEELKIDSSNFGNEEACLTRMGVISSMTHYKFKKNVPITRLSSLQKGDKSNRYLLDLNSFKKLSSTTSLRLVSSPSIYH